MTDDKTTVARLKEEVRRFCDEREWDRYHGAKDLAIGLATESSELLELFRFKSDEEVEAMLKDPAKRGEMGEELADSLYFILRFSQRYGFDLADEFELKMAGNEKRYPKEKSKGSNRKYTEL